MSKTADIEALIVRDWLRDGPRTLGGIADLFYRFVPGEELTWLGIAMHRLEDAGEIVFPGCASGHNHDGPCLVEVAR